MSEEAAEHRTNRVVAALCGAVAAAVGLGVAELVAGLSDRLQSPVLDVGDRVVDAVPAGVKELAIDWFGTGDKQALLTGIGLLLGLYALAVGVVWFRDRRFGLVGVALFGVVGAAAALDARTGAPWWSALPSVLGATAAAGALTVLERVGDTTAAGSRSMPGLDVPTARRRLLAGAAALTAVAAIAAVGGRRLRARFGAGESRAAVRLPAPQRSLAGAPAGVAAPVAGVTSFFTPNDRFYRIDTALTVPQVPTDTWSLRIHGMVDREVVLSFADLLDRPLVEADITLTCVSNEVGGNLVGTARWLGARLDALLAEAGIDRAADQVVGRSVDGYTCGFPVAALDGRDALVAVGMNGEPLPLRHGFPARLIVPGLYGYVSATKWLTELELTRFDRFDQYWVPRGWEAQAPIKTMSRIDTPRGLSRVQPGTVPVAGVAWAQTRGISAVEVQVDGGRWQPTTLADELNDVTWRQWSFPWEATPGRHTLAVRATDGTGAVQTGERSDPMPDGATGWHQVVVLVDAGASA